MYKEGVIQSDWCYDPNPQYQFTHKTDVVYESDTDRYTRLYLASKDIGDARFFKKALEKLKVEIPVHPIHKVVKPYVKEECKLGKNNPKLRYLGNEENFSKLKEQNSHLVAEYFAWIESEPSERTAMLTAKRLCYEFHKHDYLFYIFYDDAKMPYHRFLNKAKYKSAESSILLNDFDTIKNIISRINTTL